MNQVVLIGRVCSEFKFKTTLSGTNLYNFHLLTIQDGTRTEHNISTNSASTLEFISSKLNVPNLHLKIEGKITYSRKYTNILASSISEVIGD